jgi:hypothetical protein
MRDSAKASLVQHAFLPGPGHHMSCIHTPFPLSAPGRGAWG